jgi:tRNA G18 (ribose-2'-O)-methylase SpoU
MNNVQLTHAQNRNLRQRFPFCLLAHDLRAPTNVGSIFRIADAFGVEKVYLSGSSPVPPHPKIRKTSRSAEHHVPYAYASDPADIVHRLRGEGYLIVSLEITSASVDVRAFSVSRHEKICLVLGSEQQGVRQDLLDLSDQTVHIPMFGENSSMNVATACSVAVFEIIRQYPDALARSREHHPSEATAELRAL